MAISPIPATSPSNPLCKIFPTSTQLRKFVGRYDHVSSRSVRGGPPMDLAAEEISQPERIKEEHYREVAVRLRLMADLEPLASVRRHLQWLAREHDEVANAIRAPELA